jgi:hypothetical protein
MIFSTIFLVNVIYIKYTTLFGVQDFSSVVHLILA